VPVEQVVQATAKDLTVVTLFFQLLPQPAAVVVDHITRVAILLAVKMVDQAAAVVLMVSLRR
jgi:hypothetical protein